MRISMASQRKASGSPRISRLYKIIQDGKYAADGDRLINIVELLKTNDSLREREELDRDLHMWRHQGELRAFWVPDVNDIHWRSWMFGTLLHLRRFIAITKPEDRCQCKGRCLSNPLDHWPECQNGKELKKKKEDEAEKGRNRKLALAISKTMEDAKIVAELTDEEVRNLQMRCMEERLKRCI